MDDKYAIDWCHYLIKYLLDNNIDHFFVASGGRSLFLLNAIAKEKRTKIIWGIDERSLGFMALGYAKKNKNPCIVITTSGTAVANLYPSVVEAYYSDTPLILITADVPETLRNKGSNQTINQAYIFSNHVENSLDLNISMGSRNISEDLKLIGDCINNSYGPTHINLQFPDPALVSFNEFPSFQRKLASSGLPKRLDPSFRWDDKGSNIFEGPGLLVVGEMPLSCEQKNILRLAEKINWPIYADISSNMRFTDHPSIWHHLELALRIPDFFPDKIEKIVFFGGRIVSKLLWQLIKNNKNLSCYRLSKSLNIIDPVDRLKHYVIKDFSKMIDDVEEKKNKIGLNKIVHEKVKVIAQEFLSHAQDNEAYYCNFIFNIIKDNDVFISSSMPIRDINDFALSKNFVGEIFVNRGASGIDGIISTACGVFLQNKSPGILIIGDLSFLHDTNGLMMIKNLMQPILIILINNHGGGIFQFMKIKNEPDIFNPYVITPHEIEIEYLCKAHSIKHVSVNDPQKFSLAIENFFQEKVHMVIEVVIKREENFRIHSQCFIKLKELFNAQELH